MAQVTKAEWRRRHAEAVARMAKPPEGWLGLPDEDTRRERVTMRLPVWVLEHFRAQGPGYQLKIETVLAAWVAGRRGDVKPVPRHLDPEYRAEVLAEVRADMAGETNAGKEKRESAGVPDELALAEMGINYYRRRAKVHAMLDEEAERRELERRGAEGRPG